MFNPTISEDLNVQAITEHSVETRLPGELCGVCSDLSNQ